VQRLVTGALPLNTVARTIGYNIAEASVGRVVVTADPSGDHLNPAGTVHGGFAATLLDTCMGFAVHTTIGKRLQLNDTGIQGLTSATNHARDGPNKSWIVITSGRRIASSSIDRGWEFNVK